MDERPQRDLPQSNLSYEDTDQGLGQDTSGPARCLDIGQQKHTTKSPLATESETIFIRFTRRRGRRRNNKILAQKSTSGSPKSVGEKSLRSPRSSGDKGKGKERGDEFFKLYQSRAGGTSMTGRERRPHDVNVDPISRTARPTLDHFSAASEEQRSKGR